MQNVSVDFAKDLGKMKPMHAVNNGPVYKFAEDQRVTNIDAFREASRYPDEPGKGPGEKYTGPVY